MTTEPIVYKSKVSYLLFLPLLLVPVLPLILNAGKTPPAIILISIVSALIIYSMLFNTKYTITGDTLTVKCGIIINKNIDISTVKKIESTDSWFSAPALSFDRIEVFYNRYDSIIISPQSKIKFCKTLEQINPAIVVIL